MNQQQPEALLYAKRDTMAQGEHYLRHVSAMTGESLHAKSAIAAELAHRDIELQRLHALNVQMLEALAIAAKAIRELRKQGAPCDYWDDVEAKASAALAAYKEQQ
jgi:hypothetical protein